MRQLLTIGLGLLFCVNALADIYKWTDQKGNVHFADTPHPGATQVIIPAAQTQDPTPPSSAPATANTSNATATPASNTSNASTTSSPATTNTSPEAAHTYQKLDITAPLDQASIFNGPGSFTVTVSSVPSLLSGDKVQVLLDGKLAGESASNSVTLDTVDRGTHQVQAQIVSKDNKVLMSSKMITVFVHRPSAMNPLNKKPSAPVILAEGENYFLFNDVQLSEFKLNNQVCDARSC